MEKAYEIIEGMTSEEMSALFFDHKALVEPSYKVYQLNSKGHRYYYRFNDEGEVEFYPSVTTILSQTLPKSPFLLKWIANKGIEEADRYKMERAAYGTFMHAQFEQLLIARRYNLDSLKSALADYIEAHGLPSDFIHYADDLKKDMLAFAQFVVDYDVRPLAVEVALVHPELGFAGMIDCPCTMLAKKGGSERVTAIIDFKSGRKGFYEDCEIQLHFYRELWNRNFPNLPIQRLFNFSPKDWRKAPSYNLANQTDSENAAKMPYLLELAKIEDAKRNNIFTAVGGEIDLSNGDFSGNITAISLADAVKSHKDLIESDGTDEEDDGAGLE